MSLELLWEQEGLPQQPLPEALRSFYAGGLGFEGPCVYANFVETLDGVVAIPGVKGSNALVADESEDDKFVMGLLRAFADVVLIAAGTLRASPKGRWRPEGVYPDAANEFAELRAALGKPRAARGRDRHDRRVARRRSSGARRCARAHDGERRGRCSKARCRTSLR